MANIINYTEYYRTKFQADISLFFLNIPDQSRFHEDTVNKKIFSIQYERLTKDFNHLGNLTKSEKEYFGLALFFTVLIDMVCYSEFERYYSNFNRLTHYPKFIGNCPGSCGYHFHPSEIFTAMNFSRTNKIGSYSDEILVFNDKFREAIPIMEEEIKNFLKLYLTDIDGQKFWDYCKIEFPTTHTVDG